MNSLSIVIISFLLFGLIEGIWGAIYFFQAKGYKKLRMVDSYRREFGILRTRLVDLVVSKKINPDMISFQRIFILFTNIVRRPDQYESLIRDIIIGSSSNVSGSSWTKELHAWPDEGKEILMEFVNNINEMTPVFLPMPVQIVIGICWYLGKFLSAIRMPATFFNSAIRYFREKFSPLKLIEETSIMIRRLLVPEENRC